MRFCLYDLRLAAIRVFFCVRVLKIFRAWWRPRNVPDNAAFDVHIMRRPVNKHSNRNGLSKKRPMLLQAIEQAPPTSFNL